MVFSNKVLVTYLNWILKCMRCLNYYFAREPRGYIRILIYHDIPDNKINDFENQIVNLKKNYIFITPEEFIEYMNGNKSYREDHVLLTFDDGFKSNRKLAEKILHKHNIKAVFFITSEFINCIDRNSQKMFIANNIYKGSMSPRDVPSNLGPMSWDDLGFLIKEGHMIGAHSKTHRYLSEEVIENVLKDEIIDSADFLELKLGIKIRLFAYPFGTLKSLSEESNRIVNTRFDFAFNGIRGRNNHNTNPLGIRRESVSYDYTIDYFNFIVMGGLSWYYYFERKKVDKMTKLDDNSIISYKNCEIK
jgi:peptidoglycan/xylan/chitin deacetylase (PgdA/CDA1 family)